MNFIPGLFYKRAKFMMKNELFKVQGQKTKAKLAKKMFFFFCQT